MMDKVRVYNGKVDLVMKNGKLAKLAGQTVVVTGMVASVRYLFTRDRQPFVSAILEDIDGRVEVMAWPKVYAITRNLWQEGNMLMVGGKVRLRDDRAQLTCDYVRHYQPEAAQDGEPDKEEKGKAK